MKVEGSFDINLFYLLLPHEKESFFEFNHKMGKKKKETKAPEEKFFY